MISVIWLDHWIVWSGWRKHHVPLWKHHNPLLPKTPLRHNNMTSFIEIRFWHSNVYLRWVAQFWYTMICYSEYCTITVVFNDLSWIQMVHLGCFVLKIFSLSNWCENICCLVKNFKVKFKYYCYWYTLPLIKMLVTVKHILTSNFFHICLWDQFFLPCDTEICTSSIFTWRLVTS